MSDLVQKVADILNSDPNVTAISISDDQVAYWTNLPLRRDDESFDDYLDRLTDDENDRFDTAGLRPSTYSKLCSLGFEPYSNDCEGCENEHAVSIDAVI